MNERIRKLRLQSLEAENRISEERAVLLSDFYRSSESRGLSVPVMRALAFKYVLSNKEIPVTDGELIVGERGPEPKAVPTYPEVCLHSIEDLEIIAGRKKVFFKADEQLKEVYKEDIIPFWKNKSIRDIMFSRLPEEWKDSYKAGVFTEFLEQRAPGHTVLGGKMFRTGLNEIIGEIDEALHSLDMINDPDSPAKEEELNAMRISAEALIGYAERYAEKLEVLAASEKNNARKAELKELSRICRKVPAEKPETFHEALQHYWFLHLGVITELNPWDSFNPGRLDQHLIDFYLTGVEDGSLTGESVRELLSSFWIKFNNHPAPPKMGVTAKESNTYTDFALINVGGVKPDGSDAVNDLTFIILDVIEEMRILQPSSMIQVSKKNPDLFIQRALKIISTGFGQPSVFNTDAIIQELMAQGKGITDARAGGASGCVEAGAFGTESYILTGYFNLAKIFEITLHNGFDPRTQKQIGPATGDPEGFQTFDELFDAFRQQVDHFAEIKIRGNNVIGDVWSRYMPAPFLSILIEDCIANGVDYNSGGARYNTTYIQGVGLGSLTDAMTSVKYNVFDEKKLSMKELMIVLDKNFEGSEDVRKMFVDETPKYGNDEDYPDEIAVRIFNTFHAAVDGKAGPRKSLHRINMLPTTSHVYFGSVIGALPEGRKKGEPLSEGISPVQGADRKGPSAVLKSASRIDHIRTGGTLLNQKFSPSFFKEENSMKKIVHLIRGYFRLDGHHVQFNVVDADTLRKAKKEPEKYRDLIVRVAGYSDYFVDLGEELQDEIIRRTEHESV